MASFVGNLIPISSIKKIGLTRRDIFIHHDDAEYTFMPCEIQEKFLWLIKVLFHHKEKRQEEKIERQFLGFKKNSIKFEDFG